jgi:hypothetical protein
MKTTIEMAREAWEKAGEGWVHPGWFADREKAFREFEALVRADQREIDAKVCETHTPTTTPTWVSYAAAIRARST